MQLSLGMEAFIGHTDMSTLQFALCQPVFEIASHNQVYGYPDVGTRRIAWSWFYHFRPSD